MWNSCPCAIVAALVALVVPMLVEVAPAQSAVPGGLRGSHHPSPSASVPSLQGPITGPGKPSLTLAVYPLSKVGYSESEFFFSGTANSYASSTALTSNGQWSLRTAATAPYKSRLVVVRPTDPARFSGTVIVEWLNDSAGMDEAPDWLYGHDEIYRSGDAWVGVSAQAVGVNALKKLGPGALRIALPSW